MNKVPKNWKTFYANISQKKWAKVTIYCETATNERIKADLGAYWEEFVRFWAQGGETATTFGFIERKHNRQWFVMYAYKRYEQSVAPLLA